MQLQTFQGSTMAEALQRVKNALGNEAVILHTRAVQHRRWGGLKRFETYEITASHNVKIVRRQVPDRPAPNPTPSPAPARRPPAAVTQPSVRDEPRQHPSNYQNPSTYQQAPKQSSSPTTLLDMPAVSGKAIVGLSKDVSDLKGAVEHLVKFVRESQTPHIPDELCGFYRQLTENLVAKAVADDIIKSLLKEMRPESLSNASLVREKIAEHLEKLIPVAGAIKKTKTAGPHIVALIGPTGVGKTTTIAKLAANLKLREKKRVGLITIDTFRIAAIDQLKRYADILGAPLRVVGNPADIKDAIAGMSDCDYILIDTAGRSPKDSLKLSELKQFISFAEPDDVYLVLSTTSCENAMNLALEKFGEVRVDKLIFTKLDEAAQLGMVLNVCRKLNKGLAYVTNGQDVPDDIEVGHGRRLANLILGNP